MKVFSLPSQSIIVSGYIRPPQKPKDSSNINSKDVLSSAFTSPPIQDYETLNRSFTLVPSSTTSKMLKQGSFMISTHKNLSSDFGEINDPHLFGSEFVQELFPALDGAGRSPSIIKKDIAKSHPKFELKSIKDEKNPFFSSAIWSDSGVVFDNAKESSLGISTESGLMTDGLMRDSDFSMPISTALLQSTIVSPKGIKRKKGSDESSNGSSSNINSTSNNAETLKTIQEIPVSSIVISPTKSSTGSKKKSLVQPLTILPQPLSSDLKSDDFGNPAWILDPLWTSVNMMPPLQPFTKAEHHAIRLSRIIYDLSTLPSKVQSIMDHEVTSADIPFEDEYLAQKLFCFSDISTVGLPQEDMKNISESANEALMKFTEQIGPDDSGKPGSSKRKKSWTRGARRSMILAPSENSLTAPITKKLGSYILKDYHQQHHNLLHGQYQSLSNLLRSTLMSPTPRSSGIPTNVPIPEDDMIDKQTLKRLRNRVSASRCRLKKRVGVIGMEQCSKALESLASETDKYIKALEEEKEMLLHMMLISSTTMASTKEGKDLVILSK